MENSIQLQTASILQVPFSKYEKDFIFIVNNKEFRTNRFIADLLSPIISKIHINDPTIKEFCINTKSNGDFQQVLDLIDFQRCPIESNNINFFEEVFEQLGTTSIDFNFKFTEITINNVIDMIQNHENKFFLTKQYSEEIDFLSANFSEIYQNQREKLFSLSESSLENIIKNEKLILSNEDELLNFINELYKKNRNFAFLYEYVYFTNIEAKTMEEFLSIFDDNDLTRGTWKSISKRLICEIEKQTNLKERYKASKFEFVKKDKEFDGIFSFLKKNSNINDEVNITFSSNAYNKNPFNLFEYDDNSKSFSTCSESKAFICFEFKKHKIIPTYYTIRSINDGGSGYVHPTSWVIEYSDDSNNWIILSEEKNESVLNGKSLVHTFKIQNQKEHEIKFIRIRLTGKTPLGNDQLWISAIEFYGRLK